MKLFRTLLLASVMFAAPSLAEARTLALLVGVADYNDASGIKDLLGPRNDVSILWRALKQRGAAPDDITVLADNLPTAPEYPVARGLPESAIILAELDRLAETAGPGDTVLFYYSGHGSRQPDNPAEPEEEPETDGMDQVILPADVGKFSPITGKLKNAIVDDVLGQKISAIRAKGAFVWAVVDSCHSGTVTRGEQVTRSVDPALLGIPEAPVKAATRSTTREGTIKAKPKAGEGGLVGFYAVESYTEAIERSFAGYNLPMVGEGDEQRMGVFTFLLHRALSRNTAGTFRELAQEIVGELNADSTGGKVPPPVFDGDLDAPLPGSDGARLPNSTTGIIENGTITLPVGSLNGYDAGAVISLYAPGKPEKVIGTAEVTGATAITSTAGNLAWGEGATPIVRGTVSTVVTEPAVNFRFVVSPPPPEDFAAGADSSLLAASLEQSFAQGAETIGIELGQPGNPDADVLLRVKDGRVWILRPDKPWVPTPGAYDETPSLALSEDPKALGRDLKSAIWSLARASKLLRVAAALGDGGDGEDGVTLKATRYRLTGDNAKAQCGGEDPPADAEATPIDSLLPAAVTNCDFVSIDVTNESDQDYYVAGLYVDALGGVFALPRSSARKGCTRLLTAGAERPLNFRFWIDTWDEEKNRPSSVGAENFVILAVPKDQTNQAPKLCALTQPTLSAMQELRSAEAPTQRNKASKLAGLLGAVEGNATRGMNMAESEGPSMSGGLFIFDVKP